MCRCLLEHAPRCSAGKKGEFLDPSLGHDKLELGGTWLLEARGIYVKLLEIGPHQAPSCSGGHVADQRGADEGESSSLPRAISAYSADISQPRN